MKTANQVERCQAYLESSSIDLSGEKRAKADGPVITISRAGGARGNSIAEALVRKLNSGRDVPKGRPWTLFNQNLVEYVIKQNKLPERSADFFPEDGKTEEIRSIVGEILGLHEGVYNMLAKTAETIHRLGREGNTVIVGRGGNFITADIARALHVRLVGSTRRRIRRIAERDHLSDKAAAEEVDRLDRSRKRYVKRVFRKDIGDSQYYDLVLNTDDFTNDQAADLIIMALIQKLSR